MVFTEDRSMESHILLPVLKSMCANSMDVLFYIKQGQCLLQIHMANFLVGYIWNLLEPVGTENFVTFSGGYYFKETVRLAFVVQAML